MTKIIEEYSNRYFENRNMMNINKKVEYYELRNAIVVYFATLTKRIGLEFNSQQDLFFFFGNKELWVGNFEK